MNTISITFAKLAALYKEAKSRNRSPFNVRGSEIFDYLSRYRVVRDELISQVPELYSDLPRRKDPMIAELADSEHYRQLVRDLEYIFEVRANSELNAKEENVVAQENYPKRVFISHGRSPDWREVQSHIEKDLRIDTLELAQEPNRGRTSCRSSMMKLKSVLLRSL